MSSWQNFNRNISNASYVSLKLRFLPVRYQTQYDFFLEIISHELWAAHAQAVASDHVQQNYS